MRVGWDVLGAGERQQRLSLEEVPVVLDPQGVDDVEGVGERQVGQP